MIVEMTMATPQETESQKKNIIQLLYLILIQPVLSFVICLKFILRVIVQGKEIWLIRYWAYRSKAKKEKEFTSFTLRRRNRMYVTGKLSFIGISRVLKWQCHSFRKKEKWNGKGTGVYLTNFVPGRFKNDPRRPGLTRCYNRDRINKDVLNFYEWNI